MLCHRLQRILKLFRFLRHSFQMEHLFIFYFAYFESIIRYGCCFWGLSAEVKRLFVLQKRCLRTILCLKPRTSCRNYFKRNKVSTIYNIIIFETCLLIHKNCGEFFKKNADIHNYNTRKKENVQIQIDKNRVFLHQIKIYNKLPSDLKSTSKFKSNLKKLLKNKVYYNIEEFLNDELN